MANFPVNLGAMCIAQFERAVGDAHVRCIADWVASATYVAGNWVVYSGQTYICRVGHTGITTTPLADTTNWQPMILQSSYVVCSAPTTHHTVGEANSEDILIGDGTTEALNLSGARTLEVDNYCGIPIPCRYPQDLWFTGFAAGDVVEVQVWGEPHIP